MALAQERTPARGEGPPASRELQGGFAGAAAVVAERLAAAFPRVEGLLIGLEGSRVLIDRGTTESVFQGMELDVFREGEEFRHPLTGESLGKLDKDLGRIRILHVHERYSEATVIKKSANVELRKGDRVRVSMARMIVAFPNVEVEEASGVSTRTATRELAVALVRTGRFELIEERQLRSLLVTDKTLKGGELAEPFMLQQLADKGKVQALFLSRLTPTADGTSLDVQAYSTLTGNAIVLASAVIQPGAIPHEQPSRRSQPTPATKQAEVAPPETGKPAVALPAASGQSSAGSAPTEHVVLDPVIDGSITAMAISDLEGNGKSELLLAGADRLMAFHIEGTRLKSVAEYPLGGKGTVVTLDTLDVTGDGKAEIIMTTSHRGRYYALVVQLTDGKFRPLWEITDLVLRPLSPSGNRPQLFGQAVVRGEKGTKPIRQYTWDGQTFQQGSVLDGSTGFSLLEFMIVDLGTYGVVRLVPLKEGSALEAFAPTGERLADYRMSVGAAATHPRVNPRLLIEKAGDRPRIIIGREQETGAERFRWWTTGTTTSWTVLTWDGAGFHTVREIPITDGALIDYAVADVGGGLGRRLLALIVKSGRLGWGTRSEIHAFRLP